MTEPSKTLESAATDLVVTASDVIKATAEAFPEMAGQGARFYAEYITADGLTGLIIALIWLIVAGFGAWFLTRAIAYVNSSEAEGELAAMACVGSIILTAVSLIVAVTLIGGNLPQVIAPEGYMLKEVIHNLRR